MRQGTDRLLVGVRPFPTNKQYSPQMHETQEEDEQLELSDQHGGRTDHVALLLEAIVRGNTGRSSGERQIRVTRKCLQQFSVLPAPCRIVIRPHVS